jgi:hypothetical protein
MLSKLCAAAAGVLALSLSIAPAAAPAGAVRVWVIGSLHTNITAKPPVAVRLRAQASRLGREIAIETFQAADFSTIFADAVARNDAPDILVFDNFGIFDGITTRLGRFEGIAKDPAIRPQLIKVTGAFDELLGPQRGWTYLFASSRNHALVKQLALRAPECGAGSAGAPNDALTTLIVDVATAAPLVASLGGKAGVRALPLPATITSPANGKFPQSPAGDRFGDFRWRSSPSENVVAEIAEFSNDGDVRLFLMPRSRPSTPSAVSAGKLWTTKGQWSWRIWSVSESGDIAFSEARTFLH